MLLIEFPIFVWKPRWKLNKQLFLLPSTWKEHSMELKRFISWFISRNKTYPSGWNILLCTDRIIPWKKTDEIESYHWRLPFRCALKRYPHTCRFFPRSTCSRRKPPFIFVTLVAFMCRPHPLRFPVKDREINIEVRKEENWALQNSKKIIIWVLNLKVDRYRLLYRVIHH